MGDDMLKDQPFNQVQFDEVPSPSDPTWYQKAYLDSTSPLKSVADTGLQDGMLAYYLSQTSFTDWLADRIIAGEDFDCRDMLGNAKK